MAAMRNRYPTKKTKVVSDPLGRLVRVAQVFPHPLTVYLLLVALVTTVLAWRFPNLIIYPNFYAEDGSVFLQNIMDKGFLGALFTPFNGYFTVGLYLLCDAAVVINSLLGGDMLTVARAFALTAIIFLAAVIALPYLLFTKDFGKAKLLLVVTASSLLPLPQSPHTIIGVIGNQKFTFTYLAFLLTLYRIFNWRQLSWRQLASIDLALLICIYTNSVAYFLLPILAIPYLSELWRKRDRLATTTVRLLRNREVISLLVLYLLTLPQIVYVVLSGIPAIAGYLDTAYQWSRTLEIFGNRTLLYGPFHLINGFLGDLRVLVLVLAMLIAGWLALRGKERITFFVGVYTAILATLLFVINRPGVSDFFFGYKPSGSGPDQFFFAQTLIMYLPLTLLLFGVVRAIRAYRLRAALISIVGVFVLVSGVASIYLQGGLWRNAGIYENYNQTFIDQALQGCDKSDSGKVSIKAYVPASHNSSFVMNFARPTVCTDSLASYQTSTHDLGLVPHDNNFHTITKQGSVSQTFIARQNDLNGIQIFLSNFGKEFRSSQYSLRIRQADCQTVVREVYLPRISLDNSYYRATFDAIPSSKNKKYCLTVDPPSPTREPLAIQLSAPGMYRQGALRIDTDASEQDMVFRPTYSQVRQIAN